MTTSTSSAATTVTPIARSSGVGRFYSKIRHTIEDNLTPKISGKLYKAGKHSKSLTALSSIESTVGKYTPSTKASAREANSSRQVQATTSSPYAECYNTSAVSNYFRNSTSSAPAEVDSADTDEDEMQMSFNLVKTSLEDEIFEELEKVAHDEKKLNAVLKSFDKILFEYNDPEQLTQTKLKSPNDSGQDQTESLAVEANKVLVETTKANTQSTISDAGFAGDGSSQTPLKQISINTDHSQTDCCHPNEWQAAGTHAKLEKSSSCLSLTRRKCYQSPDSPCLRQMRNAFAQQQRSTSVWDLSNSTKIPILKAIPLQKRSNSFCYQNNTRPQSSLSEDNNKRNPTTARVSRAKSHVSNAITSTSKQGKSDTALKSTRQELKTKPKRTLSNISVTLKPTPPRRKKTSDELLDKCLEKGQQILRKVESINTQRNPAATGAGKKSVVRAKSNASNKLSKDTLATMKRKQMQHKYNYANEEKFIPPPLESCKIIPPVLGLTSDKHAELLVNVVQASNTARLTTQRQMSTDSGIVPNFRSTDLQLCTKNTNNESDSDDSGHISNENMEITKNHLMAKTSLTSLGDSLLQSAATTTDLEHKPRVSPLESFEPISATNDNGSCTAVEPSRVCTTCRIAQVDAVKVIRTHVEIYPNFTKEVTIRIR